MAAHQAPRDILRIPIKDVRLKEAGGSGAFLVISLKKQFEGQVRQLMYGAWSLRTGFGKFTVVVDDDIDIWDDFAVDWALSWHVRPDKDIYMERDVQAVGLDPSQAPARCAAASPNPICRLARGDRCHAQTRLPGDFTAAERASGFSRESVEGVWDRRLRKFQTFQWFQRFQWLCC